MSKSALSDIKREATGVKDDPSFDLIDDNNY